MGFPANSLKVSHFTETDFKKFLKISSSLDVCPAKTDCCIKKQLNKPVDAAFQK